MCVDVQVVDAMVYVVAVMHLPAGLEDTLFDETGSSDDEEDRQTDTSGSESDVSIDDIITDLGGGLSLMERYPVLLNDAPPGSSNSQGMGPNLVNASLRFLCPYLRCHLQM